MASPDGVVVFMGKIRRIHEFLVNNKKALQEMHEARPEDEKISNRLYEMNYTLDKFWEIVEGE